MLVLLAFPPFNFGLLVFVALVPWLISLRETNGRQAWKSGYTFGLIMGFGQLYWLGMLAYNWTKSPIAGLLPWLLAAFAYAVYFGWVGVLISKCYARNLPWLIPIVWAGIEVFRSYIPIFAFPWGLLATPLWKVPAIAQAGHYGMIFLVSAWAVTANVILSQLLSRRPLDPSTPSRPLTAAFVLILLLSVFRYLQPEQGEKFVVTAGQPGVDMAFGNREHKHEDLRSNIQPIIDRAELDGTQLIVLPEGIADARRMPPNLPFLAGNVPILLGARRGTDPVYQSALGRDTLAWKYVDKTRLVIFGEFVPGRDAFPWLASAFKLPTGDMSAGNNGTEAMKLAGHAVGPIICFEALFPDIAYKQALNGSQMLAVISIDDWYMDTTAPDQLAALSVWRSIETGLPLVRSATLGYTLVTDSKGRVVAQAPLKEPHMLRQELTLPKSAPMSPLSAAFPLISLILTMAFALVPRRRSEA